MRLALFTSAGVQSAVCFEQVLHILPAPRCYALPLLRRCFDRVFIYQGQVLPLLVVAGGKTAPGSAVPFVLVCEAEFGRFGIPAETIERITVEDEHDPLPPQGGDETEGTCKVDGHVYRLFDLNQVLEAPA